MADKHEGESGGGGGTATVERPKTRPKPKPPKLDRMPQWKVLLHNDDVNEMEFVIDTVVELAHLTPQEAILRMLEAHDTGVALLLTTHRERAELIQEQFTSKQLTVTIEPEG